MGNTTKKSPGRPPKQDPQKTKARLLSAASEVLLEKGWRAFSLREVTRRADVDPSLVRYHFGAKAALRTAALESILARISQVPATLPPASPPQDKTQALAMLVRALMQALAANPRILTLFQEIMAQQPLEPEVIDALTRIGPSNFGGFMMFWQLLTQDDESGWAIRDDIEPMYMFLSLASLCAHYFTVAPMMGHLLGVDPHDPTFLEGYTTHIIALIRDGIFLRGSE